MLSEAVVEKIHQLPLSPGVYLWKNAQGRIIYVGKAVQLRNRVLSYIRKDANRSLKVAAMMKHAVDLETIMVSTEMEALLLENTYIKKYQPRYNILLRDDKTYPYIKVTVQEVYPRVFLTRQIRHDGARYFGPFTDVGAVHRILDLIQRRFHLRTCRTMRTDRPCLQYHLDYCKAPCAKLIPEETYRALVMQVVAILEGKDKELIAILTRFMAEAAEKMDFEKAALYRDQIKAIESIQEQQHVIHVGGGDLDVISLVTEAGQTCVQIYQIRSGKLLGREIFYLENSNAETVDILTEAVLDQYYDKYVDIPQEIIVPALLNKNEYEEQLRCRYGHPVSITIPQRGLKKKLLTMAETNGKIILQQRRLQWQYNQDKTMGAVEALAEIFDLPRLPLRMECFDISHTQGIETVASMVVFENGRPAKREYRRFKLRTVQGKPDDFKSMAEIMQRRYGEKEWPIPDLIIIDGGLGQLHAALPIIRKAGCMAPVISLAKRIEEVFVEGSNQSIILSHHTPELQLLQAIRDESHRFAITYHRTLRGKRGLVSLLDHIEGVGPKRRKALWLHFKNMEEIKQANVEALTAVPGMNKKVAENIYNFFRLGLDERKKRVGISKS